MIRRTPHVLRADPGRVIAKAYLPGEEINADATTRAGLLMARILALSEPDVVAMLERTLTAFRDRHDGFEALLERHYALVAHRLEGAAVSPARRLLIGAYFTNEYAIEGAALFNPSIVAAPDQTGMSDGRRRFIMSLRAVGEGHISSIEFRTGIVDVESALTFDPLGPTLVTGERSPPAEYDKAQFFTKLMELHAGNALSLSVLDRIPDRFTPAELERSLAALEREARHTPSASRPSRSCAPSRLRTT